MNIMSTFLSPRKLEGLETCLLLPLRNMVLLPKITLPAIAGKPRSMAAVEAAMLTRHKHLIIAAIRPEAQKRLEDDENAEIETLEELYPVATLAVIQRVVRLPVGPIQLVVQGQERVKIEQLLKQDPAYEVEFRRLPKLTPEAAIAAGTKSQTLEALNGAIKSLWREAAAINPNFPEEILAMLLHSDDPMELAYETTTLLQQEVPQMQAVLEQDNLEMLLRQVLGSLQEEIEVQRLRGEILGETRKEIDDQQREFILRQQLKKIQEELGEGDPERQEIEELRKHLATTQLPEVAEKQAKRELARLERIGSSSAEGGVIRTYLDWLLEMPWNKTVQDNLNLKNAREVLDADHHGLDKIKDRIIEHLATFKLKQEAQTRKMADDPPLSSPLNQGGTQGGTIGTVLCFAGPPGVGKTSLGRSIARALGRPFERISLGGLRDEAELRGHRRTYIGAMPGRIVQALHRAGVKNPVIMLDELDKIGMDYRGDPASALLEILDPQQNYCFRDLYLDLDFDLSHIFFIGTANDLSKIPAPLLDRLEIIELSGYSDQEKLAIAQKYLLPRQIEKAGLPADAVEIPRETLSKSIEYYTREAGVRKLEQQLGAICRKVAVRYANGETNPVVIHPEQLQEFLGPRRFLRDEVRKVTQPGVATGLAWTLQGGEVLFVEAVLLPEGKDLTLTGQLGEVMQESARIARSYVWSSAAALGIDLSLFKDNGLHIHVPAGAIPKDGPSAGVTMVTAIASLLTNQPVRTDTAMTGEINLSGEVLPIGGVREKVLAAHRAGMKRVLLPQQNGKDLVDVPEDVCKEIELVLCDRIQQVLENALINKPDVQPHQLLIANC
ncbi:endopeptidase La [Microseira wollei]|uniref:Lon protease n=1 Tax=Microseira wollei NIES-4236 TaxID=2530354 RepID=A0AAV3XLB0_9CYAN|nr:endopeptidase La [Microseira wollei]GET41835.1 ATP-dependent protease Lon [Microseira wollei NIES-4236]